MDSIVSVYHQYVSGTADVSSCDVRDLCRREDQRSGKYQDEKKKIREFGIRIILDKDFAFADVLNIDTTYNSISKDV